MFFPEYVPDPSHTQTLLPLPGGVTTFHVFVGKSPAQVGEVLEGVMDVAVFMVPQFSAVRVDPEIIFRSELTLA